VLVLGALTLDSWVVVSMEWISVNGLRSERSPRIAWIEGIRILGVVMLLLYHAQLRFTGYAYTPKPTGLADNLQRLILPVGILPDRSELAHLLGIPAWFGFQFIDVFVLISGFCLVVSLPGQPLDSGRFLRRRLVRVLWPFWTTAWMAYLALWAIASITHTAIPNLWQIFAATTFPLLFSYNGEPLMSTSSSWWVMSLILSFVLLAPFLCMLLQRWGAANLLLASTVLTLGYRALAVRMFDSYPTYVIWEGASGWQPFASVLAKLSTFVLGMVVGHFYLRHRGPALWTAQKALIVGIPVYCLGFVAQFYRIGWIVADLLVPIGLALICMVICRFLAENYQLEAFMLKLGSYSYSYFLVQGLVVDRTMQLVIGGNPVRYDLLLPVMVAGTLVLAMIVDYVTPLLRRIVGGILRDIDYVLVATPDLPRSLWDPKIGDAVRYRGEAGWTVLKVEKLLDERDCLLCQVSDGHRSLWVNEDDLEPAGERS